MNKCPRCGRDLGYFSDECTGRMEPVGAGLSDKEKEWQCWHCHPVYHIGCALLVLLLFAGILVLAGMCR